jgi:excisionase family DNA binding protein
MLRMIAAALGWSAAGLYGKTLRVAQWVATSSSPPRVGSRARGRSPMANDPKVLTAKEVCKLLQVHPSTVYKLIREGKIPAFRIGSDWRFSTDLIMRWMNEHSLPSTQFDIDPQAPRGPER